MTRDELSFRHINGQDWFSRSSTASILRCSLAEVKRLAAAGVLEACYPSSNYPMFRRSQVLEVQDARRGHTATADTTGDAGGHK